MNQFTTDRVPKRGLVYVDFNFGWFAFELEEDRFPLAFEEFVAVLASILRPYEPEPFDQAVTIIKPPLEYGRASRRGIRQPRLQHRNVEQNVGRWHKKKLDSNKIRPGT